jgi:hypothetical protein
VTLTYTGSSHSMFKNSYPVFRRWGRTKESVQVQGLSIHFVTSYFFMVRSCWHLAQPQSWRTTPCQLPVTTYSMYSQLPSITGGCSSIRNLRTCHAVVTGTHFTWTPIYIDTKYSVTFIDITDFDCVYFTAW